jgi:hypothetical protein
LSWTRLHFSLFTLQQAQFLLCRQPQALRDLQAFPACTEIDQRAARSNLPPNAATLPPRLATALSSTDCYQTAFSFLAHNRKASRRLLGSFPPARVLLMVTTMALRIANPSLPPTHSENASRYAYRIQDVPTGSVALPFCSSCRPLPKCRQERKEDTTHAVTDRLVETRVGRFHADAGTMWSSPRGTTLGGF